VGPDNRMTSQSRDLELFVESLGRIAAANTEEQVVREIAELFRALGPATTVRYAPVRDGQITHIWPSEEGKAPEDELVEALHRTQGLLQWDSTGDRLLLRLGHRGATLGFAIVAGATACLSEERARFIAPALAAVSGLAIGSARIYGELGKTAGELEGLAATELDGLDRSAGYLSTPDLYTGLYNRTFFDEELARLEHSRRFPISIIVADVRGLRPESRDHVMQEIARALDVAFRGDDVLARIGEDRFGIILPDTTPPLAVEILDRIGRVLAAHPAIGDEASRVAFGSATAEKGEWLIDALHRAEQGLPESR
jgi:diguanylate cyclase (GGDEF)-like protein